MTGAHAPAGMAGALYQNRWPDHLVMLFATIGISVPSFILATVLIYTFALWLKLLEIPYTTENDKEQVR